MADKRKVIIDCDTGVDDSVAILLCLKHLDVLGITTVGSWILRDRCSLKAAHDSHSLHASPVAVRCWQLMVFAKIRAQEVLPTPRGPQNK